MMGKAELISYRELFERVLSDELKLVAQHNDYDYLASWKAGGQDFYAYAETISKQKPVDLSVLIEYLEYDYDTGEITWIKKPKGSRVEAGDAAGCLDNGYIRIKIGGELIMAHRIAWALYYGAWPYESKQIDHKNGCRSDNRIDNLRLVTNQQNAQNRSKAKGYRKRPNGKFQASIKHNGNAINLGTFDTEEEAREAYKKAKVEIHDCYPWECDE